MIGRGDADGVDGFVGQDLAEIADTLGVAVGGGDGALEVGLVDIADRGRDEILLLHRDLEIAAAHGAHADEPHADLVIGAERQAWKDCLLYTSRCV